MTRTVTEVPAELVAEIEDSTPVCQWVGMTDCAQHARWLIVYTCSTCGQLGCVAVCTLHRGFMMLGRGRLTCGQCEHVIDRAIVKLTWEKL